MVSIIVPVYGVERYLPRCIDSILAQNYRDFELILIDDESPDRCGEICDEYALRDGRIKVIHKKNGGVSAARNTGLDAAAGEYVAFCDSDDYWHPEYLDRLVTEAQRLAADVVVCNYIHADENGVETGGSDIKAGTDCAYDLQSRFEYLVCGILNGRYGWAIWNRLFRNRIIRGHHIRFCTSCGNYAEDLGFVFQYCCFAEKFVCIPDRLYYYVIHQGSMMDCSKGVLKLDQMNELSMFLYPTYRKTFGNHSLRKCYPVIHFMLMCPEYKKIACKPEYCTLGKASEKIDDLKYYRRQLRKIFRCYGILKRCFGKNLAKRCLLLASYARHGSWKRFTIESAITYKWLVRET